jgi:prephenate dehydrogenase
MKKLAAGHLSGKDTGDAPLRIAVVGHRGRMGEMLMSRWQKAGHEVQGVDRDPEKLCAQGLAGSAQLTGHDDTVNAIAPGGLLAAVQGAHAVALCVPAKVLPGLLADLRPLLDPRQILFDITSIKMLPMEQMEAAHHGPVIGSHPLFGPSPEPEDLIVALTPGLRAREEHIRLVEGLYTAFGCRVFRTTAKDHDQGAAYAQGLNFISSAAYFASLAQREDVLPFLTPSFRRRLAEARKLLTEDGDMFHGVTVANPMTKDAIHSFRMFLDLAEGDGLSDVVRRARWWYESGGFAALYAGREGEDL